MKKIFLIVLFTFASFGVCAQNWQSVVKSNGSLICKVEIQDSGNTEEYGTGFLVETSGKILTNAHVVQSARTDSKKTITLTFPFSATPDKRYIAQIERFSSDLDLCIIKVPAMFPSACRLSKEDLPGLMSEILVLGFPLGKNFKSTPGYVQAYQDIPEIGNMLDLSASIDPGNSGGPVFNSTGEVVGIVAGKFTGYNFNLAIPVGNALTFLSGTGKAPGPLVTSTPEGARVFVNKTYKGATPFQLEIFIKNYDITVEKDGFEPLTRMITEKTHLTKVEDFQLKPKISTGVKVTINTNPQGAKITVDNSEKGLTPTVINSDKGGKLRVRVLLPGYKEQYKELGLDDRSEQTFNLELEKSGFIW